MIFFAHAGHDHEAQTVSPTPAPEPVLSDQPYPATTTVTPQPVAPTLSPDMLTGGGLLLGLVAFWLLATYVFRLELAIRLVIIMTALLIVGIIGYQFTPVTSIVALTAGIALALSTVLAQLSTKSAKKPKA